ncbi:MAG: flagellar hook protein FlgE [Nitrospina sp.]|nr:flagellar hook protein FlgE [Nitrospina sp.]
MSLVGSLFTGVSGLQTNSQAMNILGDNISNVNTIGFKASKGVFGDLFSTILSNGATTSQVGRGTQFLGSIQNFGQGSFETSSSSLDMALDGSGFFIVNDGQGNFYTRNGQFRLNDDGEVQLLSGQILQGFRITNGVLGTALEDVDLAGVQSSPNASTNFTLGANLNGAASAGITFNSPVSLFNSSGSQVVMSIQFTKQAVGNNWSYNVTLPSGAGTVTGGASGTLNFGTDGQLTGVNGGAIINPSITIDYSGANPPAATQTLTWNLLNSTASGTNGKMTAFAAPSNNNSIVQDGFPTGTLVGLGVDKDGIINGLFNNGQSEQLFQVALADFLSPTGLTRTGQNLFAESGQSGQPIIATANTGGFGSVLGQSLELSNVDLANEFVNLITTQQAFQASARVITTTDDLLSETVNLTR